MQGPSREAATRGQERVDQRPEIRGPFPGGHENRLVAKVVSHEGGRRNEGEDQRSRRLSFDIRERLGLFRSSNATGQRINWLFGRREHATHPRGRFEMYMPLDTGTIPPDGELILTSPAGTKAQVVEGEREKALASEFPVWKQIFLTALPKPESGQSGGPTEGLPIDESLLPKVDFPCALEFSSIPVSREAMLEAAEHERRIYDDNKDASLLNRRRLAEEAQVNFNRLQDGLRTGLSFFIGKVGAHTEAQSEYLAQRLAQELRRTESPVDVRVDPRPYGSREEAEEHATFKVVEAVAPNVIAESFPRKPERSVRGIGNHHRERWGAYIPGADDIPERDRVTWGRLINEFDQPGDEGVTNRKAMERFMAVWASTGAGKSALMELMIYGAAKEKNEQGRRPGVLLVDLKGTPTGQDSMGQHLANMFEDEHVEVTTVQPGNLKEVPMGFNPINPGKEKLHTYLPKLAVLLTNAFELTGGKTGEDSAENRESTLRIIMNALEGNSYRGLEGLMRANGWDPETGKALNKDSNPFIPQLVDLVIQARESASRYGYSDQVGTNLPIWAEQRVLSLATHTGGRFFSGYSMDTMENVFNTLEKGGIVHLDLSNLDEVSQSLAMSLAFLRVQSYAENTPGADIVLALDEINKMAKKGSPMESTVVDMIQRARSKGIKIILGGQDPAEVPAPLINNTDIVFVGKLTGDDNKKAVQGAAKLTMDQLDELADFKEARFAHFAAGMHEPVLGQITDTSEMTKGRNGNAKMGHPENLADHPEVKMYPLETLIEWESTLDREPEGAVLTAFAEVAAATTLGGMERHVGINWGQLEGSIAPNPQIAEYFHNIEGWSNEKKEWEIEEAARRAVLHRPESNDAGKRGIPVAAVVLKVERDLKAAFGLIPQDELDFISGDTRYDTKKTYVPPTHRTTAEVAVLTHDILSKTDAMYDQVQKEVDRQAATIEDPQEVEAIANDLYGQVREHQQQIPRHADSDKLEESLGHAIPGETAYEQVAFLTPSNPLVKSTDKVGRLLFVRDPQTGGYYMDRTTSIPVDDLRQNQIGIYMEDVRGMLSWFTLTDSTKRFFRSEAATFLENKIAA